MIADYLDKVKSRAAESKNDLFIASLIFLTGLGGFGLGRLSAVWPQKEHVAVIDTPFSPPTGSREGDMDAAAAQKSAAAVNAVKGKYVASKSGSSYHLPWCPGAKQIKASNKIWFQTKEEAETKGYKPAGNCPGL